MVNINAITPLGSARFSSQILVAIINYGVNSTNKISHTLTELKIEHQILKFDDIPYRQISHVILSGGPDHVYEQHRPIPEWVIKSTIPVLGICYGMQLIAHHHGGRVIKRSEREHGCVDIRYIFNNKMKTKTVWMNRYDKVIRLPNIFTITSVSEEDEIVSFTDNIKWWAVQYHPENSNCPDTDVFVNFLS